MMVFKMCDSVTSTSYSPVCNLLNLWRIWLISTYSLPTLWYYFELFCHTILLLGSFIKGTTLSSFVSLFSYWACFIKGTTLSSFVTLLSYWAALLKELLWALLLLYSPTGHALLKELLWALLLLYYPTGYSLLKDTTLSSFVTLLSYWVCFINGYYFELFCYSILLLGMLY